MTLLNLTPQEQFNFLYELETFGLEGMPTSNNSKRLYNLVSIAKHLNCSCTDFFEIHSFINAWNQVFY